MVVLINPICQHLASLIPGYSQSPTFAEAALRVLRICWKRQATTWLGATPMYFNKIIYIKDHQCPACYIFTCASLHGMTMTQTKIENVLIALKICLGLFPVTILPLEVAIISLTSITKEK